MRIDGETKICALIGDPVEHTLSPCIHNAAFEHLGLNYVYVAFNVKPRDLEKAIKGVLGLGIHGLNVTMPHKTRILSFLDRLDPNARLMGAVNTILNDHGKLVGYNTDGVGALRALLEVEKDMKTKNVLILGAGGASRAISFALATKVFKLVVMNRTFEKAVSLVFEVKRKVGGRVKAREFTPEALSEEVRRADIIINATPIGMHPQSNETPIPPELLRPDMTVFDLVYNPLETKLLKEAKKVGARTIDGLKMLVYQGAASFKIWTGIDPPLDVMLKAARREILSHGQGR